jgi:hypothetical protein
MWKISRQSFGFVLTFSDKPDVAELTEWLQESRRQLSLALPDGWGLVVDMREMKPLGSGAQRVMTDGQKYYKERGMVRVAVVLNDPIAVLQFRRLARVSGVDKLERFISVAATPNWQVTAKRWVADGLEPPQ